MNEFNNYIRISQLGWHVRSTLIIPQNQRTMHCHKKKGLHEGPKKELEESSREK